MEGSKKLNLGCGQDIKQGYVNADIRKLNGVDIVVDMEKPLPFQNEEFDEVLMKDSMEHVSWRNIEQLINEVHRILKKGGKLIIQCPDLEEIAKQVILNPDFKFNELEGYKAISFWVYGEQNYPENTHKSGFTKPALRKLLESHGFKIERMETGGTNIICEAVKL